MFTLRNTLLKNSFSGKFVFHSSKRTNTFFKKGDATTKALEHFDDFYKALFQMKWPSIRLALLSKGKSVAVLNNFGETEKVEDFLLEQGALDLKKFLESLKSQNYGTKLNAKNTSNNIEKRVLEKFQEKEEKDKSFIHPDPTKFELVDHNEKTESEEKKREKMYDITEARSSLYQDKLGAEYDTSRLILPDCGDNKANFYDFLPATQLRGLDGYILESEYYKYYSGNKITNVKLVPENEITFPEHLKVFTFDRADVTQFPPPTLNNLRIYDYLVMDGSDILPVLALDVQAGDYVLHLGYNSGTMGYCLLQTLRPKYLICSGTKDFNEIFKDHLYDYDNNWNGILYETADDYLKVNESDFNKFDKILVDVPSTNDKSALHDLKNNFFHNNKITDRLQLPKEQTNTLVLAMNLVRPGGTIVYTTSTLSPVQNDSVVNEALHLSWLESKSLFTVKDLSPALNHMTFFYNFDKYLQTKYGSLVIPFLPSNFGPRYFCKLVKNEREL